MKVIGPCINSQLIVLAVQCKPAAMNTIGYTTNDCAKVCTVHLVFCSSTANSPHHSDSYCHYFTWYVYNNNKCLKKNLAV